MSDTVIDPAAAAAVVDVGGQRFAFEPHNCFACGSLNEAGLRLPLHAANGRCWTEISLPRRFEGWQGMAHGGIVCTILDEVMAWALVEQDAWGVTARLNVTFKAPVRIETVIRGEGWLVDFRRRLMRTAGRLVEVSSGRLLATAEGLYVAASEERKRELKARYRFRSLGPSDVGSAPSPTPDPPLP
jgi:acyl dehydratase